VGDTCHRRDRGCQASSLRGGGGGHEEAKNVVKDVEDAGSRG
jgi:hypothetical protein